MIRTWVQFPPPPQFYIYKTNVIIFIQYNDKLGQFMKGTLFTADFVKDNEDNLRLLEINTDTALPLSAVNEFDYSEFFQVLSDNNITKIHVVYKEMQEHMVSHLSQSVANNATFITDFQHTIEEKTTIYPTNVDDSADLFILRMAYDESAIFDSTYCKNAVQTLNLFNDNDDANSVIPYYYSSSAEGVRNTLLNITNNNNVPDITLKEIDNITLSKKFVKLNSDGTPEEKINQLISDAGENILYENYINDESQDYAKSIRSANIIYGSDLNTINLFSGEMSAIFQKPEKLSYDSGSFIGLVNTKHLYEFTTNHIRSYYGGIFEEESILDTDGNGVPVTNLILGETYKSYYVEGTPDSDLPTVFENFQHPGSQLPSGSFITSSVLVNYISGSVNNNIINHIVMEDGSDFRAVGGQHLLVYDIDNDYLTYEMLYRVQPDKHKFLTLTGETASIDANEVEILDGDYKHYTLDMEETDTFLLENGGLNVKIVTHNCFPAGTKVSLPDGSRVNIETLQAGDEILTYDVEENEVYNGVIGDIRKSTHKGLINLYADNETDIRTTPLHKFYVVGKGYITANQIRVGDKLVNSGGEHLQVFEINHIDEEYEVYHLVDVRDRHNYFVEDVLVHNSKAFLGTCFPAGTQISLENGEFTTIENIKVGDVVLSYNEETNVIEPNSVIGLKSPIHDDLIKITLSDSTEITSTHDHPYYTNDNKLISYRPDQTNDRYNLDRDVEQMEVGHELINTSLERVEIVEIEELDKTATQTYVCEVENNHNFFANRILVHNK